MAEQDANKILYKLEDNEKFLNRRIMSHQKQKEKKKVSLFPVSQDGMIQMWSLQMVVVATNQILSDEWKSKQCVFVDQM